MALSRCSSFDASLFVLVALDSIVFYITRVVLDESSSNLQKIFSLYELCFAARSALAPEETSGGVMFYLSYRSIFLYNFLVIRPVLKNLKSGDFFTSRVYGKLSASDALIPGSVLILAFSKRFLRWNPWIKSGHAHHSGGVVTDIVRGRCNGARPCSYNWASPCTDNNTRVRTPDYTYTWREEARLIQYRTQKLCPEGKSRTVHLI